jgi:hypothetical protein
MTKKAFKEMCSFHEYGKGSNKRNAIYFDWKTGQIEQDDTTVWYNGFKFMVKTSVQNLSKAELFNEFYQWVVNEVQPNYSIQYRYAIKDTDRFKVSIMG